MSDQIQRPVFYEGQILGALDLEATVDYSRGQEARHERYLHTWGIAAGLDLKKKPKQIETSAGTVDYVEVVLSPGVAIDGRGREIVVAEEKRLVEDDFVQLNVAINDKTALYPVLLIGRDTTAPASAFNIGDCAAAQPTRKVEDYEITFRSPGEDLELNTQTVPEISEGPGSSNAANVWMVLLGFVRWDKDLKKFTDIATTAPGVARRYAGVLADEVAARGGSLLLRTQPKSVSGKPALLLDETGDGELKFGLLNAAGAVTPLLTVTSKGDLTAVGTISGAAASGNVYIQSGVAMDGVVLPLPRGVAEEQVGPGKAVAHIYVNLRPTGMPPPDLTTTWIALPQECEVDANRRVRCLVNWFGIAGPLVGTPAVRAGQCDYFIVVSVPAAEKGATP
jgi:hypothetical protein